jgi:hypothetical protein
LGGWTGSGGDSTFSISNNLLTSICREKKKTGTRTKSEGRSKTEYLKEKSIELYPTT